MSDDDTPVVRSTPVRSLWQREPVRVMNILFTFIAAVNAILLGADVYDGAVAGIVTGVIAAAAAAINELFTRAEVVPLQPLRDLAAATEGQSG